MKTTLRGAAVALAAAAIIGLPGCRVERTRGQRRQVQAIDTILRAEADRLQAESNGAGAAYAQLVDLYAGLTEAAIDSGSGKPDRVQEAEDDLLVLLGEAKALPAYRSWDAQTQRNVDRRFWSNRLTKWRQWRGPGHDMPGAEPD